MFGGVADGGTGNDTLELASAASVGTIAGIGTSFVNFGTITEDSNAQWVLSGNNTISAGETLNDFGTLTVAGTLVISGATVNGSGTIDVLSGSQVLLKGGAVVNG